MKELIIKNIDETIQNSPCFFTNIKSFNFDYTPDEIFPRKELQDLINAISFLIKYRSSHHILLLGGPGTGKTTCLNWLIKNNQIEKKYGIEIKYINCISSDTTYQVICDLTGAKRGMPSNQIFDLFFKNQKKDCIIILDEINRLDILSQKSGNLLYFFSRPGEVTNHTFKNNISLILISNNLFWDRDILSKDNSVYSSLQFQRIIFSQYSTDDVFKILKLKAQSSLKMGCYDEDTLSYIAKLVNDDGRNDTRVAIMTLKLTIQYLENNQLNNPTNKIVYQAYIQAILEVEKETLGKLNLTVLTILYACALGSEEKIKIDTSSAVFNQVYLPLCKRDGRRPVSFMGFHNHLNYLSSVNLITTYVDWKNKTKNKYISLNTSKKAIEVSYQKNILSNQND